MKHIKAAIIDGRTSLQLCADFLATESNTSPHIYTVRGWIMEALDGRHPEAFDAWMESGHGDPTPFIKASIEHANFKREYDLAPWSFNY